MLSRKQEDFLRGDLHRINLLYGSVRSGKTWISLLTWAIWVGEQPAGDEFLMVGKTLTTLKRNCLIVLQDLIGDNMTFNLSKKEARIFNHRVFIEGANDVKSEGKIRGMTLKGVYIDELTLIPEDFYLMALSRLSVAGAKLIATTNPDSPEHYVKKKIIDNGEIDLACHKFLIDDNVMLDEEYKQNLKKEYTGVFYKRFIDGEFVAAEGLIYEAFANDPDRWLIDADEIPRDDIGFIFVGQDFGGNKSKHTFTASAISRDRRRVWVLASEEYDAKGKTVEFVVSKLDSFCEGIAARYGRVDYVFADSAEQTIINTERHKTRWKIRDSIKRKIVDRIRCEDVMLSSHRLAIVRGENDSLVDALRTAVWDDKAAEDVRLDVPGKTNICPIDAFEYSWELYIDYLVR